MITAACLIGWTLRTLSLLKGVGFDKLSPRSPG